MNLSKELYVGIGPKILYCWKDKRNKGVQVVQIQMILNHQCRPQVSYTAVFCWIDSLPAEAYSRIGFIEFYTKHGFG